MTQYSERDIKDLDRQGNYYSRHVSAMTGEGLHDKSDIAAELAWRDARIDALEAQLDRPRIKMLGDLIRAGLEPDNIPASLARLKAKWQADAVSTFAFHHLGGHEQEVAENYASKLRRQAKGDQS